MSYIDAPRIHFGGVFSADPPTLDDLTTNFLPDVPLTGPNGAFVPERAGWNPRGAAQFFFRDCRVLSVVDATGKRRESSDQDRDPLMTAVVQTPSPYTSAGPGGRLYSIAKLVDLDPDQQGRTEIYGLRLDVLIGDLVALKGHVRVPSLRDLWRFRMGEALRAGAWQSVSRWQSRLEVEQWGEQAVMQASPLLAAFRQACRHGVSVSLTLDLLRDDLAHEFTQGDEAKYGRVMGTLGPLEEGEPEQFVAGRRLEPVQGIPSGTLRWGPAQLSVRPRGTGGVLTVDLGGAMPIKYTRSGDQARPAYQSDGVPAVEQGIQLAVRGPDGALQRLSKGEISLAGATRPGTSSEKSCELLVHSGVIDVNLTPDELTQVQRAPLTLLVDGKPVLEEHPSGRYLDADQAVLRLEQGQTATARVHCLELGRPRANQAAGLQISVTAQRWVRDPNADPPWRLAEDSATQDVRVRVGSTLDAAGVATVTIEAPRRDLHLEGPRAARDSQVYLLRARAEGSVGDGGALFSVLLWRPYQAPDAPTWERDVGPILKQYARIYPGMKSRLDIGDERTVLDFRQTMTEYLGHGREDAAYMPVTRDLSDAKVSMILKWLSPAGAPSGEGGAP